MLYLDGTDAGRVILVGGDGDDKLTAAGTLTQDTNFALSYLDGDDGNDVLYSMVSGDFALELRGGHGTDTCSGDSLNIYETCEKFPISTSTPTRSPVSDTPPTPPTTPPTLPP